MPIYEYQCRKCGSHFEVIQRFGEKPVRTCRRNGCPGRVDRLLSVPNVIYKGSGFYTTDYARGSQEKRDAEASPDSSKKSDSASDPKKESAKTGDD